MENMKKKILFIALFLVAAVVTFQIRAKRENRNYLMLENIEALASNESSPPPRCFGSGSVDCPITHVKVYFVGSSSIFSEP